MNSLKTEYYRPTVRQNDVGFQLPDKTGLDTQLVSISNVIIKLKVGKAVVISRLTHNHLLFSHQIISVLLSELFQLMFLCQ